MAHNLHPKTWSDLLGTDECDSQTNMKAKYPYTFFFFEGKITVRMRGLEGHSDSTFPVLRAHIKQLMISCSVLTPVPGALALQLLQTPAQSQGTYTF